MFNRYTDRNERENHPRGVFFALVIGCLSPVGFSKQENLDNELVKEPSILPEEYVEEAASVSQAGAGTTIKIYPIADAFVDSQDNPNGNYGGTTWIAVNQAGASRPESTWLKFDLSSIPSSATVTNAVFRAYAYQIWWRDKRSAALWDVNTNAWSESTITANNAPWGNRGSKISSDVTGSVPGWWEWNVTSWANTYKGTTRSAWLSNAWSVGGTHYGQYYYSKEYGNITYRPYLEVTYVGEDVTVKLNPIADAFTDLRDNPYGNYGSQNWIGVNRATKTSGTWPWPSGLGEGTFIKFDLSGIPTNATVTRATFGAYAYDIWWDSTCTAFLRRFGTNWDEYTITGMNAPWGTLGGEVSSVVSGSIPSWWAHSVDVWYVQGKLGGQIGFYYCYPGTASGYHYGQYYRSREYANPNYRPYLEITYETDRDAGVEWVEDYPDPHLDPPSDDVAEGFLYKLPVEWTPSFNHGYGWSSMFGRRVYSASERHFEKPENNGWDSSYIDAVDFALFSGHGCENFLFFGFDNDGDGKFRNAVWWHEAEWGDGDLEWIVIHACEVLKSSNVFNRWGWPVFRGLHAILGFASTVPFASLSNVGVEFVDYMTNVRGPFPIIDAWKWATRVSYLENVRAAYLVEWNNRGDYLPGYGPVYPDVNPPIALEYLSWEC